MTNCTIPVNVSLSADGKIKQLALDLNVFIGIQQESVKNS